MSKKEAKKLAQKLENSCDWLEAAKYWRLAGEEMQAKACETNAE